MVSTAIVRVVVVLSVVCVFHISIIHFRYLLSSKKELKIACDNLLITKKDAGQLLLG